jgi:hypothetical protein
MRNPDRRHRRILRAGIVDRFAGLCARMPVLLAVVAALTAAGTATAGRQRTPVPTEGGGLPATPEPGAALAFAVGVGVIAWAVRRNRKP